VVEELIEMEVYGFPLLEASADWIVLNSPNQREYMGKF